MKLLKSLTVAVALTGLAGGAMAAEGAREPKEVDFSFAGPFGTFDRAAVQRGFQVFKEVCSSCHSLEYFAFRNLTEIGYSEDMAKAIASEYQVTAGPDPDTGEMYQREARLSDYWPWTFENEEIAKLANGGALPPDLSLITKARAHGPEYVYSLLTGYEDPPADVEVGLGQYYNPWFPGGKLAMAQPLVIDGQVEYMDGTDATVEQMSKDVVTFLHWTAEPRMEDRKSMGLTVILFMLVLTGLFYASMKKIWKPVKQGATPWKDAIEAEEKRSNS